MILDVILSTGDWEQTVTLVLRFSGNGQGSWQVTDPYWINLLAKQNSGPFEMTRVGGLPSLRFYDGDGDEPAFALVNGPAGEWDRKLTEGLMVIHNPRNRYGLELDAAWRVLRSPF